MAECTGKNCAVVKKLLKNISLHCQSCKKLLRIPVILVDGVGNVCENCIVKNEWEGTRNDIFDVLLQELTVTVPCTNANAGCNEEIADEHFEEHLKLCKFRPVKCPRKGCQSMETQNNLSNHFLENHKEDVIASDTFNFQLNHQQPPDHYTKLLVKRNLIFLFDMEFDAGELACTLFKFHENAPCSTTITFCNDGAQEFCLKIDINPLNLIDGKCSVGKVNLAIIKTIFQESNVLSMIVKIPPSDRTLESLKCPMCEELMGPPIFLCKRGHSLCNYCFDQLKNCPICSTALEEGIRNYHLESTTSNIFYSCVYKTFGCCAVLSGDEVMDHESNCSYHLYTCPFDCQFQYNSKTILNHLNVEHGSVTNKFEFDCKYGEYNLPDKDTCKFMYIDGRFFNFQYKVNPVMIYQDDLDWTLLRLDLLNNRQKVKDLCCKVTMTNPTAQATITQVWFLNDSTRRQYSSVHKSYSILIPIESWGHSLEMFREDNVHLQFKCELFKV